MAKRLTKKLGINNKKPMELLPEPRQYDTLMLMNHMQKNKMVSRNINGNSSKLKNLRMPIKKLGSCPSVCMSLPCVCTSTAPACKFASASASKWMSKNSGSRPVNITKSQYRTITMDMMLKTALTGENDSSNNSFNEQIFVIVNGSSAAQYMIISQTKRIDN